MVVIPSAVVDTENVVELQNQLGHCADTEISAQWKSPVTVL
jgi:hypothetical protein